MRVLWDAYRNIVLGHGRRPNSARSHHFASGIATEACWRSRIVLLSSDGVGTSAIMAATGKLKTCVWRWQERFMLEGTDGLLREKTRPPGTPKTAETKAAEVIRLTQEPPPHEATHWTLRAMGKAVGLAASTVRSIWKAHGLSPHRWRQFKLSNDPEFAKKLNDVVGLYVSPPAHAVVLLSLIDI